MRTTASVPWGATAAESVNRETQQQGFPEKTKGGGGFMGSWGNRRYRGKGGGRAIGRRRPRGSGDCHGDGEGPERLERLLEVVWR